MLESLGESAVYQAYRRAPEEVADDVRGVDLVALWDAGGRRRGRSPRQWARRCQRLDQLDVRGEAVLATPDDALAYAEHLDTRIALEIHEALMARLRADPGRLLSACDSPLVGFFARIAAEQEGVEPDEAGAWLMARVKEHARRESLDDYAAETAVARARRAIDASRPRPGP
jgi:hypothetical protein